MAGKIFIEILFVVISDLGGNFGNGNIRLFQQHFCLDYLELIYVFVDGHGKFVRKKLVQIILRYACDVRRLFCRDAVGVIFGDVFRRLAQIFYTRKRMNCVLCDVIVGYLQKYRGEAEIDVGRPVAARGVPDVLHGSEIFDEMTELGPEIVMIAQDHQSLFFRNHGLEIPIVVDQSLDGKAERFDRRGIIELHVEYLRFLVSHRNFVHDAAVDDDKFARRYFGFPPGASADSL